MFLLDHEASWPAPGAAPGASGSRADRARQEQAATCVRCRGPLAPAASPQGRGWPEAPATGEANRGPHDRTNHCAPPADRCYGPPLFAAGGRCGRQRWVRPEGPRSLRSSSDGVRSAPRRRQCFPQGVDVIVDSSTSMEALRQVDDAEILWTACAGLLREQVSEAVWQTTFALVEPAPGRCASTPTRAPSSWSVPSSVVRGRIEGAVPRPWSRCALADVGGQPTTRSCSRDRRCTPIVAPARPSPAGRPGASRDRRATSVGRTCGRSTVR